MRVQVSPPGSATDGRFCQLLRRTCLSSKAALCLVFLAGAICAPNLAQDRSLPSSRPDRLVGPFLDLYDRGEYEAAGRYLEAIKSLPDEIETVQSRTAPIQSVPGRVGVPAFDVFARSFANMARDWVRSEKGESQQRRLRVASLAVLEAADGGFSRFAAATEWVCNEFRKYPPTQFEHVWQLAVLALAQSGGGAEFLIRERDGADHLKHAVSRYPSEPRFALAIPLNEMVARIANNRPGIKAQELVRRSNVPDEASSARFVERVLTQLDGLASLQDIAEEALMRAGIIRFQLGRFDSALANLSVAAKSDDQFVRYMSSLFEGKVLEALGRRPAALAAYEAAHQADPKGQAAALQYAAELFTNGRRSEAASVIEGTVRDRDDAAGDWWYVYGSGDFRFWKAYQQQLRESLKK